MKLIELSSEQYEKYISTFKNTNFYTSSNYFNYIRLNGSTVNLYAVCDSDDQSLIKSAIPVITYKKKTSIGEIQYAYSPCGFIMNYKDTHTLKFFTKKLRKHLAKQNILYLRINPNLIYGKYSSLPRKSQTTDFIEGKYNLERLGFEHLGYNTGDETIIPRYFLKYDYNNVIENNYLGGLSKNLIKKINEASEMGIEFEEGTFSALEVIYNLNKTNFKPYKYYSEIISQFGSDAKIYLLKFNPYTYLKKIKAMYEQEYMLNEKYNEMILDPSIRDENIISTKMTSDRVLSELKMRLNEANNYAIKYNYKVIIGGSVCVKTHSEITMLFSSLNTDFSKFYAQDFFMYNLINTYYSEDHEMFSVESVTGDFSEDSNNAKLINKLIPFDIELYEYVGEMDLPVHKYKYKAFRHIKVLKKYLYNKENI